MVTRLYVHNYRCLENFELKIDELSSALIVGRNGAGKTTVRQILAVLQQIGRGINRVGNLIRLSDFSRARQDVPLRIEIEVQLAGRKYHYSLEFELPTGFRELRVAHEELLVDGESAFSREKADVSLLGPARATAAKFRLDWHLIALPVIQDQSDDDPLAIFKSWLGRMLILSPVPSGMMGESVRGTLEPEGTLSNVAEWFRELTTQFPASYADIERYLKGVMPDLSVMRNVAVGSESRQLMFDFKEQERTLSLPLDDLSDGEKCLLVGALVVAANKAYGPLLCFWDEPDNHIGLSEVNRLLLTLRKGFKTGSQFLATTHNPEAIRAFPSEKILIFSRASHLDPTRVRAASELDIPGELSDALARDDVEVAA